MDRSQAGLDDCSCCVTMCVHALVRQCFLYDFNPVTVPGVGCWDSVCVSSCGAGPGFLPVASCIAPFGHSLPPELVQLSLPTEASGILYFLFRVSVLFLWQSPFTVENREAFAEVIELGRI